MREPVRFAPAISRLLTDGHTTFIEHSAHPVLVPAVYGVRFEAEREVAAIASLRREEGSPQRFASSIADAHLARRRTRLGRAPRSRANGSRSPPTPSSASATGWRAPARSRDAAAIGQSDPEHPLLAAAISLPAEEGWLATGRLSAQTHPWLADHVVLGQAILPGTGFVEMALKAAERSSRQQSRS